MVYVLGRFVAIMSFIDIPCSAMIECICMSDSCKWKLWRQRPQRGHVKGDLAGEAQRGFALNVLAQVTSWCGRACLGVRKCSWAGPVNLLVFLFFKYGKDPGLVSWMCFLTIV